MPVLIRLAHPKTSVVLKRVFVLGLAWLVGGCTYAHTAQKTDRALQALALRSSEQVARNGSWVLPANATVYLSYPQAGYRLKAQMPRLRADLAPLWHEGVAFRFQRVTMAPLELSAAATLAAARAQNFDLLFELQLLAVEDRLSSVTERVAEAGTARKAPPLQGRDQLSLAVLIFDVRSGRRLDTLVVNSKSGLWAWAAVEPEDLLEAAVGALEQHLAAPGPHTD